MEIYQPTIGLEIHAQLKTRTKMFCDSANDPAEKTPNINVCPICLGHPGTLPTANKKAIEQVLRVGLAIGGRLAEWLQFDRKNYFYPDLPKGYQISQYQTPLVTGGELAGIKITRVHLEEDTARSIHDNESGGSLIDFNRAGVPLMELVTEPVIVSAKQAADFAREWRLLLRYLDVSEANMEKGEMRVEANISVKRKTKNEKENNKLGIKVEVKNLNSFRSVERAIGYEIKRQTALLEQGEPVVQETRGWDENKGLTFSQREKESAHDYRYFPEPDLPKLPVKDNFDLETLVQTIPELPWQKRERLINLGLPSQDVEQYLADSELAQFFDAATEKLREPSLIKIASNFIANDIAGKRKKVSTWPLPTVGHFVEIVRRYQTGELASPQAKSSILSGTMIEVASVDFLPNLVTKITAANPDVVTDYQAGKQAALQFLVGQGMKESKGAANPGVLAKLLVERLKKE